VRLLRVILKGKVHVYATLNLTWLVLGLVAAVGTFRFVFRRDCGQHSHRWASVVIVAVIVAALFPYISATDDALRLSDLTADSQQGQSPDSKVHGHDGLRLLYETMDSPLPPYGCELIVVFLFSALVAIYLCSASESVSAWHVGRAPPSPAPLA
jgi:FtsH-binding integral membrane protein